MPASDAPETAQGSTDAPVSPDLLLGALRDHLLPDILWLKLPIALEIYAHIQLISRKIIAEAYQALAAQMRIAPELSQLRIAKEDWAARGALTDREVQRLTGWTCQEQKAEAMILWSLTLRKRHLAQLIAMTEVSPDKIFMLADTYFPERSTLATEDGQIAANLYIEVMTDKQWLQLEVYRDETQGWCDDLYNSVLAGRPRPSLVSLLGEMTDAGAIGRRMLEAAEKVVEDAKAFEAMFDPTAPVKPVAGPQTQTLGTQVQKAAKRAPPSTTTVPSAKSRQSLPNTVASSSKISLPLESAPAAKRRATLGSDQISVPSKRPHDATISDTSRPTPALIPKPATKATPAQATPQRHRRFVPHKAAIPDYTRPIAVMGSNVPKASLKPFDARDIKRSRPSGSSTTSAGKADARERDVELMTERRVPEDKAKVGTGVVKRKALGNAESLENSQSSGESQGTKDKRRLEKGKGRAIDPALPAAQKVVKSSRPY